jgi:hypothetical protein
MPAKGERSHPLEGVKGSKKRLPKLSRAPEAVDLDQQSSIYLVERNQAMRLKRMREEMLLAKERNQLIERELANLSVISAALQCFVSSYPKSQRWGAALMRHPTDLEALVYMGRKSGASCLAMLGDSDNQRPYQSLLQTQRLGAIRLGRHRTRGRERGQHQKTKQWISPKHAPLPDRRRFRSFAFRDCNQKPGEALRLD